MRAVPRRLALGAALLVATGAASTAVAQQPDDAELPVAGTFRFSSGQSEEEPEVRGAVHAVRRVEGGTAVYFSVGAVAGQQLDGFRLQEPPGLSTPYGPNDMHSVRALDLRGLTAYLPMFGTACLCSQTNELSGPGGTLHVGYALLPPLPATVREVSVQVGFGLVEDVPVEDGPLLPAAEGAPLALGSGWPALPEQAAVQAVRDPGSFAIPLIRHTADSERTVTVNEQSDRVDEDLSADVLFAVGSAALTPAARETLAEVAGRLKDRAAGSVSVVGHTDATGSDAANQSLSEARARSVRDALQQLTGPSVTFTASGRGEQEPVADNGTPDGRQANRRVTVGYGLQGSS